jgi:hypothetical protein
MPRSGRFQTAQRMGQSVPSLHSIPCQAARVTRSDSVKEAFDERVSPQFVQPEGFGRHRSNVSDYPEQNIFNRTGCIRPQSSSRWSQPVLVRINGPNFKNQRGSLV